MKRKTFLTIFVLLLLCIFQFPIFAENYLSSEDLTAIRNLLDYRPVLTSKSPEEALVLVKEYRDNLLTPENKAKFTEQGNLILDSLLTSEEYNYYYEMEENHPKLKEIIFPHNEMLGEWIESHQQEEISALLYVIAGDLLSCSMGLYPIPKAMEIGLLIKDYYDIALEKEPNIFFGNLNMAQWYFHAPAIGGGSKKKAEELFKVALANTEGTGDEFYVNLIYSQFLYDQKDKAGAATYFQKAYDIQPDSKKLALVKLLNDNDYTLFYYTLNRAKVEKKLGL